MNKEDNGGPAFPLPLGTANCAEPSESGGMSLRDYFAAKAMSALITPLIDGVDDPKFEICVSVQSYMIADAMLEARNK